MLSDPIRVISKINEKRITEDFVIERYLVINLRLSSSVLHESICCEYSLKRVADKLLLNTLIVCFLLRTKEKLYQNYHKILCLKIHLMLMRLCLKIYMLKCHIPIL